jgi:hypothetical protein
MAGEPVLRVALPYAAAALCLMVSVWLTFAHLL